MDTPMPKIETATAGPRGRMYLTRADACAAWLAEIVGPNLQHSEAQKIVRQRGAIIRLLQQMDGVD